MEARVKRDDRKGTKGNLMSNLIDGKEFLPKEADVVDDIHTSSSNPVLNTANDFLSDEDDTVRCDGCGAYHLNRDELDDDLNCDECARNARDEEQHMKDLNADWSNSRGCNMGRAGW
jgi:hypothetical protein